MEAAESFNTKPLSNRRHVPSLQSQNKKCPSELTKYQGPLYSLSPSPRSSAPAHTSITRTIVDLRSPNRRNIPTIARERAVELSRSVEAINYIEQKLKTQQGPRIRMQRYAGLQAVEAWTVARLTEAHKMKVWSMNHEWESFTTTCLIFFPSTDCKDLSWIIV